MKPTAWRRRLRSAGHVLLDTVEDVPAAIVRGLRFLMSGLD